MAVHAHEQNNKQVKGDGGAVGLTESSIQLLRWMVSGPEVSEVITDYELAPDAIRNNQNNDSDALHHEQVHSVHKTIQTQVKALGELIETMGNPFVETSSDILVLDTKEIANEVVEIVMGIDKAVQEQFELFVEERFIERKKAVMDVIKRNNFASFSNPRKEGSLTRITKRCKTI